MTAIAIFIMFIGTYCFVNVLLNRLHFKRMDGAEAPKDKPLVSVVIPARNEEKNIGRLLGSVVEQSYENIEVFVIDDQSSDSTARIIKDYEKTDRRIHGLSADPAFKKAGNGKINALLQVIEHVKGKYIFATDADCVMKKGCILKALSIAEKYNYSMISGMPEELAPDFRTASAVGSMMLGSALIPHWIKGIPVAIGQFMFILKEAYDRTGGYDAVKDEVSDDAAIAGLFFGKKESFCYINASSLISCKMYDSFREAFDGIRRTVAGMFRINILFFALVIVGLCLAAVAVTAPLTALLYAVFGGDIMIKLCLITGTVLLMAGWFIACRDSKLRYGIALAYPLVVLTAMLIVISAVYGRLAKKQLFWKDRELKFK